MRDYTPIIPKSELVGGAYYRGSCRHATVARWDAKTQRFYHWRVKFESKFVESICCPEDDAAFDVFVAKERMGNSDEEIPFPLDKSLAKENGCRG